MKWTKFPSGLSMLHDPQDGLGFFLGVWVQVGAMHDPHHSHGLAHFLEHMLFRGTQKYPSAKAYGEAIEGRGFNLQGGTGHETTEYSLSGPTRWGPEVLSDFFDMLVNPALEGRDRELAIILREIEDETNAYGNNTDSLQGIHEIFWKGLPLSHNILGNEKSLKNIAVRDLKKHFSLSYFLKDTNIVLIGGNAAWGEALEKQAQRLEVSWEKDSGLKTFCPTPFFGPKAQRYDDPDSQHQVILGFQTQGGESSPRRFLWERLSCLLGGGLTGRMVHYLREEWGLVYDVQVGLELYAQVGIFYVQAGFLGNVDFLLSKILQVLREILQQGFSQEEEDRAYRQIQASWDFMREDREAMAHYWASHLRTERNLLLPEPISFLPGELHKEACQIFQPQNAALHILGSRQDWTLEDLEKRIIRDLNI